MLNNNVLIKFPHSQNKTKENEVARGGSLKVPNYNTVQTRPEQLSRTNNYFTQENNIKNQRPLSENKNSSKNETKEDEYNDNIALEIQFLEYMIENIKKFDQNRNILELKSFVRDNYSRFHKLIENIYKIKEETEKTTQKNIQIEKKIEEKRILENQKKKEEQSKIPDNINILEQSIEKLNTEIKKKNLENEKLKEKISRKAFFREYEMMCKELEGLKKQNQSMSETLHKEQEKQKN